MQNFFNSFAKYLPATLRCSKMETKFLQDDLRVRRGVLQPNQKPDAIPKIKKCVSFLSGWY